MRNHPGFKCIPRALRAPAAGLLLLLLAACGGDSEESRLRDALDRMQAAAVERRPGDAMEFVAADFIGNDNVDRDSLHNLLRAQALRNAAIGATRGPVTVEMQGERARVEFDIVLTGGSGGLLPERAQAYSISTGWRLEDGDWRLFLAEWEARL